MSINYHTKAEKTISIQFDKSSRLKIFEEWQNEFQKILEITQFTGNVDQGKIFSFFQAFIDSLGGKDSYQHFQIIDNLIPHLLQKNFSEHNFLSAISKLRNIVVQSVTRDFFKSENPIHINLLFILDKFDDLSSFVQRNYKLHKQLLQNDQDYSFEKFTRHIPVGLFHILGPRLSGKSIPNHYLVNLCGVGAEKFLQKKFWTGIIKNKELDKLQKLLKMIYKNRKRRYSFRYSLRLRDKKYHPVLEEGFIEYDAGGSPAGISGYIIPELGNRFGKNLPAADSKEIAEIKSLSLTPELICRGDGRITFCNSQCVRLFGIDEKTLTGSDITNWVLPKNQTTPIGFPNLVEKYAGQKEFEAALRHPNRKVSGAVVKIDRLELLSGAKSYLFSFRKTAEISAASFPEKQFDDRLKFLVEIQKDLLATGNLEETLSRVLEFSLELVPVAQAGSLLTIQEEGLHFVAAKGYNLAQLQHVVLQAAEGSKGSPAEQIKLLFGDTVVQEVRDFQKNVQSVFPAPVFQKLKKVGRLDEIKSILLGLISVDEKPFAIISLDNYKEQGTFSTADRVFLELFLQQVGLLFQRLFSERTNKVPGADYQVLAENSLLATFVEQKNELKFLNQNFLKLAGSTSDELEGKSFWNLIRLEDVSKMKEVIRNAPESVATEFDFKFLPPKGKEIICRGSFSRIRWEGETALLGEFWDVTDTKSLENQLQQTQKMNTLGTLTAGIAHDFNNILGAIYPSAQMIMLDPGNPDTVLHAETIYKMAQRANQLTKQLLAFSRSDDQKFVTFNLNSLIYNSMQLIEKSIGVNTEIELDLSPNLKTVVGDQNQFVQILMNLTVNSRAAMPEGGTFRIQTKNIKANETYRKYDPAFTPGWYVCLIVEDTGQGIPPEIREKIFEPFFTTKKEGEGTGLGLSMVYGVTKKHKGIILLNSVVGQGTKFKLYFPASDTPVKKEKLRKSFKPVKGAGTILVVDDEKTLGQTTESILVHLGYQVFYANSGKEAIKIYKKHSSDIDLILLDYVMPEMNGRETFIRLKEFNPQVQVLICSGYAEQDGLQEILENGVLGVLPKPYSIETISKKLEDIFSRKLKH